MAKPHLTLFARTAAAIVLCSAVSRLLAAENEPAPPTNPFEQSQNESKDSEDRRRALEAKRRTIEERRRELEGKLRETSDEQARRGVQRKLSEVEQQLAEIHQRHAQIRAQAASADTAQIPLDQALARVLDRHPEIIAAKARVALAQAELEGKRMELAREFVIRRQGVKAAQLELQTAADTLQHSREAAQKVPGAVPEIEFRRMENNVLNRKNDIEYAQSQMRILTGDWEPDAQAQGFGMTMGVAGVESDRAPANSMADKIKAALDTEVSLEFVETPLSDVLKKLSEISGVPFTVQRSVGFGHTMNPEQPITVSVSAIPLRGALQAIEDSLGHMQFMVRDYGVLLISRGMGNEYGFKPATDFGK